MKVFFKKMFWIIIAVYIGYGSWFFISQKSIIYYPNFPTESDFYDCTVFADTEKVDMNGTRAYYKHVGERIAVVYHGNAGSACDREYFKNALEKAGYSYLFVEYAGYAGDEKKPSRALLTKDAENAISFIEAKNYTETAVIAESIGTGVASYHVSLLSPDKVFFISPFDTLTNVAKSHFPFYLYPMSFIEKFSKENYDNVALLQDYKGALTVVHGTKDRIIPIKHGEALFEKVSTQNKEFIAIEGAGHNDIYGFDEMREVIDGFL